MNFGENPELQKLIKEVAVTQIPGERFAFSRLSHRSQYLRQHPKVTASSVPAWALPLSLGSGRPEGAASYRVFIVLPGPNAVYQPEITLIMSM